MNCKKCGREIKRDEDGGYSHVSQLRHENLSPAEARRGIQGTVKHKPRPL